MIDWLEAWPGAAYLRGSGTAYLLVNASHILGIGLLVGAILPLDLRLAGLFRAVPIAVVGPFLSGAAALGLMLAVATGLVLFSVKPRDYLANGAFLAKIALLGAAFLNIMVQHALPGLRRAYAGEPISAAVRSMAVLSASLWIAVLVAGRWIGFL